MKIAFILSLLANLILFSAFLILHRSEANPRKVSKYQICKSGIPSGEEVPPFEAATASGEQIALSSFHGKMTLVSFWALWCQPCLDEQPQIKALYEKFHSDKFTVLGINLDDSAKKNEAVSFSRKLPFKTLFSSMGEANRYLFISSLPANLLIDSNGKLIKSFSGYSNGLISELEGLIKSPALNHMKPAEH